jgi:sporulation protein YlmC with PRC-barrel domain
VAVSWDPVDEGLPIAYEVLEKGVPVLASDGEHVGTVHHVVAAPEKDIFHGLVIATPGHGRRFVEAADVASLHEHGVDLRIDSAAAQSLPEPGGGAAVFDEDPGTMKGWHHWVNVLGMRGDWHRER